MKTKPGLALDLDDTIYDYSQALHTELQVHWGLQEDYFTFWGKTYERNLWWENMIRIESVYGVIPPKKEDLDLLRTLDFDYEIYYLTSRPKEVEFCTHQYLNKYEFPKKERVIFCKDKAIVCNSLGIQIAVEDMVHHLKNLLANDIKCIAVKKLWNREFLKENHIESIFNFSELERILYTC